MPVQPKKRTKPILVLQQVCICVNKDVQEVFGKYMEEKIVFLDYICKLIEYMILIIVFFQQKKTSGNC